MKRFLPLLLLASCGQTPVQPGQKTQVVSDDDRRNQEYLVENIRNTRVVCINDARYLANELSGGVVFTPLVNPGSTVTTNHCDGKEFVSGHTQ